MNRTLKLGLAALAGAALFGGGIGIAMAAGLGRDGAGTTHGSGNGVAMMGGSGMASGMMGGSQMMSGSGMTGGPGMMGGTSSSLPAAISGARQVTVTTDNLAFTPSAIAVRVGEGVNVDVHNADEVAHDLTIPMLGIHAVVQPGSDATFGLRVETAGTYPFLCTVAGHAAAGMGGTLTVTS